MFDISSIKTVFICPDHNEKYKQRKEHMVDLLTNKIGIKNFSHYKSNTNNYPACLGEATIDILEQNMNDEPLLLLEDDVEWTGLRVFEKPVNCDAIYLGISECAGSFTENRDDGLSIFELYSKSQLRVLNMLATHSIIYISKKYKEAVVNQLKKNIDWHTDVKISRIQSGFFVLAQRIPFFYQSAKFGNVQHVENVTKFTLFRPNEIYFSFDKRKCTIVSAYYNVCSKFSHNKYMEWATNFMKLENPIVLFTTSEFSKVFKSLRGDRPIIIEELSFDELYTWKQYKDNWIHNHAIDPEKNIHSPELYSIWAEKPFFLEKAIFKNYFNTTHFFWCDVGAFRESCNMPLFKNFPMTNYFQPNKIMFLAVEPLQESDKDDTFNSRIGGGLWGGDILACLKWKNAYENMLQKYFENNRFAGKDQMIMLSAYLKDRTLGFIVKPKIDKWFELEYLLSGRSIIEYDTSYD